MGIGRRPDQLHRNPNPVARALNRSLDDPVHSQLARDLPQRLVRALVAHHRLPRDHEQRSDLPEVGDQRVRNSIRQVLLLRVAGQVRQRDHRDRLDPGNGHRVAQQEVAHASNVRADEQRQRAQEHRRRHRHLLPRRSGASGPLSRRRPGGRGNLRRRRWLRFHLHRGDETVAEPRQSLDELGMFGRVSQSPPEFVDGVVQTVVELAKGFRSPQPRPQLFPRDYLAGPFDQGLEHPKRHRGKCQLQTIFVEFARGQVHLKPAKGHSWR